MNCGNKAPAELNFHRCLAIRHFQIFSLGFLKQLQGLLSMSMANLFLLDQSACRLNIKVESGQSEQMSPFRHLLSACRLKPSLAKWRRRRLDDAQFMHLTLIHYIYWIQRIASLEPLRTIYSWYNFFVILDFEFIPHNIHRENIKASQSLKNVSVLRQMCGSESSLYCKLLRSSGIDSMEPIPACILCSLQGQYDNPIPTWTVCSLYSIWTCQVVVP